MDKTFKTPDEAVTDIGRGASVAIAGFGIGHRFPTSLLIALRDGGAKELQVVCNSLGGPGEMRAHILAETGQIGHLITSFSARPGMESPAEQQIATGKMQLELVAQGVLVERLRAAGAGLAGIFVPTGVGTDVAEGKEVRSFNGKDYLFESALAVDFALLRAHRADRAGNLQFRGGSQNFNPSFAKAAKVAIAEVDEIVETGEIPPEDVHLPGIFVDRVVEATVQLNAEDLTYGRRQRSGDSAREYGNKRGLTRNQVAQRAADLLDDGAVANLGVGLPTLVSNWVGDRGIWLHAENGILGYGHVVSGKGDIDLDMYNAGGEFVSLIPGASFFDSVTSFEIARSGRLDAVILGAYQVDSMGNIANWATPSMVGGGIGGAMDLVVGDHTLIALMQHADKKGRAKLVESCTFPVTGLGCVDVIVTDLGLFRRAPEGFRLDEVKEGWTVEEVLALTDMRVTVAADVAVLDPAGPR